MQTSYRPSIRGKITADLLLVALIFFAVRGNIIFISDTYSSHNLALVLMLMITWFFSGRIMGLYQDFRIKPFSMEWISFLKTQIVFSLLVSFLLFFVLQNYPFSRTQLVTYFALLFVFIPIQKVLIRIVYKKIRKSEILTRKVLIVGAGDNGMDFYKQYVKDKHYGYELTGFVDDVSNPLLNGQYLGKTSEINRVLAKHELDDIVVAMPITDDNVLEQIVSAGEQQGKLVRIIPDYQRFGARKLRIDRLGSLPIITLRSLPLDVIDNKMLKRIFDVIFSFLVTVFVLSWLFPIIAILIKLSSKGPVLFKQERWGLNNKSIICYKFRTMVNTSRDTDETGRYQQAMKDDPRITRVGAFLRKTNLDEIPQFINVLLGSMSVVGPRPHPVPLNIQSKDSVENYMMRHWVKPGITGWAQVNGYRGETRKPHLMEKRVEFDLWYIENWTFWLDLQIILQTLVNMVKGDEQAF
jgi:putative colanic acid biosynthesis UDP-glucose lipid carrier transferase